MTSDLLPFTYSVSRRSENVPVRPRLRIETNLLKQDCQVQLPVPQEMCVSA